MDSSIVEHLAAWIAARPLAAGLLIFLVSFGDALLILGVAVPAIPLLFAAGTLVGLGHLDGAYALAASTLGAFCGDCLSYWIGHRFGPQLRLRWPFSRYPQWLDRGESMFRRNGMKSIVIARYVGALRPFVPAIAGMLQMKLRRYAPASLIAAAAWSATFLAPGWIFGASLDLMAAVAGRLALVVFVLLSLLVLIWSLVYSVSRWFAAHATQLLERALAWSHRHPVLGRYSEALIDPHRPESASLALLALALIAAGWGLFSLLIALTGHGEPLALDLAVHQAMFALRTPLADSAMAAVASIGDWPVLLPAAVLAFGYLAWRRRWIAAWHWVAALAFGLALTTALGYLLDMPKPPSISAVAGFSFPSAPVTMATVMFGFFAVLIARELPGRRRVWPYVIGALIVALLVFARLYLGAHWLSDVLGGALLGLFWTMGLGIAYRRRVVRSFWVRPIAAIFFGAWALAVGWYAPKRVDAILARFDPPLVRAPLDAGAWWRGEGAHALPARRNEFHGRKAWPLNVQYAGALATLEHQLAANGWRRVEPGGWRGLLMTLDDDASAKTLPILAAAHQGRAEALLMERDGPTPKSRRLLRLWAAPYALQPGNAPLWIGTVQTLRFITRVDFVSYWDVLPGDVQARAQLREALHGLALHEDRRDDEALSVIRVREQTKNTW